ATLAEQVVSRDLAIIEGQGMRVRRVPAQLAIGLEHMVTLRPGRDHERADLGLLSVPAGDRGDRDAGGDLRPAVGYELLGAVDDPPPVALLGTRLGRARVGPGLRLGQAERPQLAAGEQVRQPGLLLLWRAELVDRRDAQAHRGLERDPNSGVGPRDLLD